MKTQNVKADEALTTTGKVREAIANAMLKIDRGELAASDGKNLIGLANQISNSMAVELKHQNMQKALGMEVTTFGKLNIGG